MNFNRHPYSTVLALARTMALTGVLGGLGMSVAVAAGPPDSGVILETVKPAPTLPPKPVGELIRGVPEVRPALASTPGLRIVLKQVRFSGVTAMRLSRLQDVVRPEIGKELSFDDLDALAARVTKLYRDHGYFIARAYLPQQELHDGIVEILVLEGHIGKVDVKYQTAGPRISASELAGFVQDALPPSKPVTVAELERALLLENDLPNLVARATLVPGSTVGTSDLVLEATQSGWFTQDTLEADNAGSRYTGPGRYGGSVNVASPAGLGDLLSLRGLTSFAGFNYGRLSWTTPVTETGLRLGASATYTNYKLGSALEPLDDHGDANVFSLFSVYPIIRSRMFNLYQTTTLETKALRDESAEGELANKRINVASLAISGDETDAWNGGGLTTFGVTAGLGHLTLRSGAADVAADATTANTAGSYRKLLLQAMRQQRLIGNWVLYGSVTAQFASKNLDTSESLSVGGPTGVRAYPVGEAPADAGVLSTLELRYNAPTITPFGALQGQLFFDRGDVTLHKNVWESYLVSGAPDKYDLNSVGVGVNLYKESSFLITASVAHKIGSNPDPGVDGVDADGRHLSTRFWLQAVKYW